jgi:signal transduction histidine kinase
MQEGVDDYILKGSLNRLVPSIEHNLREARLRQEYRATQAALLENQTRMHAFIADLPGMAYQIRLSDNGEVSFPYVSEGCQPLLGIEPQELVGDAALFAEMVHPEDAGSHLASMLASARQLSFWNWEGRLLTGPRKNEVKWINLRCSPRRIADAVQWEGIMLNISQSKQAEAALRQSKQQLHEFSTHIEEAREQERVAIAREVHDELGSLLTATRLDIAWLVSRLKDQPELHAKALAIEELVGKCTRSASNIARSLRPSALDTFGIVAAIESEAREFAQRTGITCIQEEMDESVKVTPHVAITLFRIFQEALNNITKHAQASQVTIAIVERDACVNLTVRDNGRGIHDADRAKPRSFGLRGIFERVAQFGGEVKLESAPGQGTRLHVRIPHQPEQPVSPEAQGALFD